MHGMHDKQGHLAASPFDNYLNLQVADQISWLPFLIHVICMHPLASHYKLSCLSSLTCITVTHFLSLHHHPTHDYTYQPIARLLHLAHPQNPSIGHMEVPNSVTHVHGDRANLVIIPIPISHHSYIQFSL